MAEEDVVPETFRVLVESADRKFARVRDLPSYGRAQGQHYFQKVFKAYMRLWKYQQEHRPELVKAGLNRWEIGEIAGRIGQLYFGQYMRTSEARFLVEAYIFYEAILKRRYFEGCGVKDLRVRFKELRFYARFLLVSLILNRTEMVKVVVEKLRALIDDCKANFRETNFKEWKLVEQEILRFINIDTTFTIPSSRPFRYCAMLNCHPNSVPYVARFHAKKVLKFRDAILMSYHRNEVKFAELTLDVYRMLQCLEWEPSGSFYQKHPAEPKENGVAVDYSGASGLIDMNLAADMTDPALPPNPRKAILYRPSLTHLIAVMATICEELPPESIMLVYLSASGKPGQINTSHVETSGGSRRTRKSMWEVILCKSPSLDLVWAQVLSDPFLRRLIVRFIFCRAVLSAIWPPEGSDQYLPLCLPQLPNSLSPKSDVVQSCVSQLADHLKVSNYFHFGDS
uniref:RGS domain-containing protein n=1 Tax=Gossypium raimondii TaxID=29730 RepID=A0A0D2QY61_GOSRA|nr:hypothetical protein B456_007G234900 [Gossypium raimondii]